MNEEKFKQWFLTLGFLVTIVLALSASALMLIAILKLLQWAW